MNAIENNRYSRAWATFASTFPKPRAVLCISAHWFSNVPAVTMMERPRTIHDFGGFPPALGAVRYPAPGSPELARDVIAALRPVDVDEDRAWGLDHGSWSVLAHMYPQADVPVVQLAIDGTEPADVHFEFGKKLAPLRDDGVLVLGSGNLVHNLRLCTFGDDVAPLAWNVSFDRHIRDALERRDAGALCDYATRADGRLAVPTPEHYLPLVYVAGARGPGERLATIVEGYEVGAISMYSFSVG